MKELEYIGCHRETGIVVVNDCDAEKLLSTGLYKEIKQNTKKEVIKK